MSQEDLHIAGEGGGRKKNIELSFPGIFIHKSTHVPQENYGSNAHKITLLYSY